MCLFRLIFNSGMNVLREPAWQWKPKVAITAVDVCAVCTVFALQYVDCSVLRVSRSEHPQWQQIGQVRALESEEDSDDLELHGHTDRISCVRVYAFSSASSLLICSASSDCVLVWQIDTFTRVRQSVLVERLNAEPTSLAFDHTGTLLAVPRERDVDIYIIDRKEVFVTLEGHIARVTKCEFHSIRHHLLITCSEDRTFKIWDLASKVTLFQSAVLSAFSILSTAINPTTGDASFGFADGTVKIFSIMENYAKELVSLSVDAYLRKEVRKKQAQEQIESLLRESPNVISSLPHWARSNRAQETAQIRAMVSSTMNSLSYGTVELCGLHSVNEDAASEISHPVLSLGYLCIDASSRQSSEATVDRTSFNAYGEQQLVDYEQFLVVGVPAFLVCISALSFKISILHDFQHVQRTSTRVQEPISVAREICFYKQPDSNVLLCGVLSAFQPCFTMLAVSSASGESRDETADNNNANNEDTASIRDGCSIENRPSTIPRQPPPKESVLNLPPLLMTTECKIPNKNGKTADKPITFRSRIKSSGYGSAPLFSAKRKSIQDRKTPPRPQSPGVDAFLKEYPAQCGLLQHYQQKHALPPKVLHDGAIHHIEYSNDAKWLATSGNDRVAQVCKLPFSRFGGEGNIFVGHDNAVRSIHWSQNNRMLLTTSNDKTARIWLIGGDCASLVFHGAAPPSVVATTASMMASGRSFSSAKKAIKQEIVDATFFYMDKFVLSACGSNIRLHQYELDELYVLSQKKKAKKNDIDVPENKSRKKKVANWSYDDMQSITSLACVNGSFLSSIIVVGGSDRSVRILDAAVGKTCRVITDAHARAVHTVVLPKASSAISHPANFYDLLLTSAANSTIHLWDIRADNCIMRFGEHVNRVHQIGVAFSPCMRYVATGSEDRMTYLYDIRTGRRLTKLSGHSDVVTSVAFNQLYPQLATASYDGTIRFYSDT